jgi:uncharacterized membrane protein
MTGNLLVFLGAALASAVEMVEALTIVLALGFTRGWRAPLQGAAAALLALAAIVAALGPALAAVPIDVLRLVVGALLLVFGLQWLRKAILRASGLKELHDEEEAFAAEVAAARAAGRAERGIDHYAFAISFKSTLLEGLEVAFIVITLGANQGATGIAAAGAAVALVVVVAVGALVRHPLGRVPENTLKFAVGVMLTSFGMFWAGEGVGIDWPGADGALAVLIVVTVGWSLAFTKLLGRRPRVATA